MYSQTRLIYRIVRLASFKQKGVHTVRATSRLNTDRRRQTDIVLHRLCTSVACATIYRLQLHGLSHVNGKLI